MPICHTLHNCPDGQVYRKQILQNLATNFGKKDKLIQNLNINLIKKEFNSSDDVDKMLTDI